ncbi:MAG: leucine-rich repeat protein [Oscillibacter sp.]|nr:leucine-rich repeat protein [Oscillibacter sp.]
MKTSFEPYEGAEPYIFVSYARKDMKQVIPLLDALHLAGYRVWYDKGIQSGKRWADSLAEHILKCSVLLFLVSRASVDSVECYDEVIYALREKRTVVPLYLEDVKLTPGLEMKLHTLQWRRMSDYRGSMDFAVSFERESAFAPCKDLMEWHNSGGIRWAIRDGELTIIQRTPDSMPDYSKENAAPWKERSEEIISAVIASGVTRIGSHAFYQCANLVSVTIPDSVTEMKEAAFEHCASLASVVIPSRVYKVGDWAFNDCGSLENVVLLEGVKEIGYVSFQNCFNLSKVIIPNSVQKIGKHAFQECKKLMEISIPDSVTDIGYAAFYHCANLSGVKISNKITEVNQFVFSGCHSLTNVTIPDGVIKISVCAFHYCNNLTDVIIPDSVQHIGESALNLCPKLSKVSVPSNAYIHERAFDSTTEVIRR